MFLFYFSCINCESINESGVRFGVVDSFLCLSCRSLRQNLKTTQALAILQTIYTPYFLIYRPELYIHRTSLYVYSNHPYIRPPYTYIQTLYIPHFLIHIPETQNILDFLIHIPGLSICMNSLYYLALIRSW